MSLEQIFTTAEMADKSFPFFSSAHLIPLFLVAIAMFILIKNKEYIADNSKKVKLILGIIILISATMKQTWYMMREAPYLMEGLPLYLCRITFLITIISFLFNFKKLNFVIIYQGSFGGLLALLVPDIGGYLFPHFFYINYFFSHGLLLIAALVVLVGDGFIATRAELIKILIYNLCYVILADTVNFFLDSNYGYTVTPPASLVPILGEQSGLLYKLIVFLILCAFGLISHLFYKVITAKKLKVIKATN